MSSPTVSGQVETKAVCLLAKDIESLRETDKQLEYFGYQVTCATDIDAFNNAIITQKPQVVVVYSDLTDEDIVMLRKLRRTKKGSVIIPQLIIVSSRDDFMARLAAVRLEAQGFFPPGVGIIQIIDKMEYLSGACVAPQAFHVLLVEDDERHVRFYTHVLQAAGITTTIVADPKQALDVITTESIDLVLMDYTMPECNGQELATLIRQHEKCVGLPIIFLSARDDVEALLIDAGLGIDEFLVKPVTGDQLVSVVRNRARRSAELKVLMARDSFTGLLNHDHFMDILKMELGQTKRFKSNTVYTVIDIDNLKSINDTFGHVAGDHVIKSLSRLLQQRLRRSDIIGRCGGEEFSIIMPDCTIENAWSVIGAMREKFADIVFNLEQQEVKVTFSAGLTSLSHFESIDQLIKVADEALRSAKNQGRNQLAVS